MLGLPAILSPTICGASGVGGEVFSSLSTSRLPDDSASRLSPPDRLRLSLAGSPAAADRIEFTLPACLGGRCYGLAVLVPLLSTSRCRDAVTVRYFTILHRKGADLHRSVPAPFQAHERTRRACCFPRPRGKPRWHKKFLGRRAKVARENARRVARPATHGAGVLPASVADQPEESLRGVRRLV